MHLAIQRFFCDRSQKAHINYFTSIKISFVGSFGSGVALSRGSAGRRSGGGNLFECDEV
jgi:hypothetical protein